ncbi:MAG: class I SAM-dependent methyltransferase [Phycisphaerales bacterium]|jgi:SAM-dependent methyltransferase
MPTDFYSIPDLYDILHTPGTPAEARGLLRAARRFVPSVKSANAVWLEPACGSGRLLRYLAARSHKAIGFDIEPAMVAYAKRRNAELPAASRPTVFTARMEDFDTARPRLKVHVAFNLINTIRHLPTDAALLQHLSAVARVLRPGGVYIVGLGLAAYGLEPPTEDIWTGSRAGVRVHQLVQYEPAAGRSGNAARAERVVSHLTVTRGRGTSATEEHIDSAYSLRSYDLDQWRGVVKKSDLVEVGVAAGTGEQATAAAPGYYLFVLGRRKDRA